jgi:hypothetical protein
LVQWDNLSPLIVMKSCKLRTYHAVNSNSHASYETTSHERGVVVTSTLQSCTKAKENSGKGNGPSSSQSVGRMTCDKGTESQLQHHSLKVLIVA